MRQFWEGFFALPVGAVTAVLTAWVLTRVWDRLDTWWRAHKPRQVRDLLSYDLETGQNVLRLADRAPMLVALAAAPKLFTMRPLPGTFVVVIRDYRTDQPDELEDVRAAVRHALHDLVVPVKKDAHA